MKLRYTHLARGDLFSLLDYIAKDNPPAARKVGRALRAAIDRLRDFPSYGRRGDVTGTRQFVVAGAPYVVIYETDTETITILRIYHTARDRPGAR